MNPSPSPAVVVVGGGIVGLATARSVQTVMPGARVTVLDKEGATARHQTGRNSGVIHSGIYYPPGSAKIRLVRDSRRPLLELCQRHGIAHEICGKVVVATRDDELPRLRALEDRGLAHGLTITRLGPAGLRDHEPHASGLAALHVAETGICDYVGVCRALADEVVADGGTIRTGACVTGLDESERGVGVLVGAERIDADWVLNCAGLFSDRLAAMSRAGGDTSIVPFRGEYFELAPDARRLVRNLIYPVPDPRFPFLGVHFTRMIDGAVHAGPNAVLALAREGYDWTTVAMGDVAELARNPGMWSLARRYWRTGAAEVWRSLSRSAFTAALQRLVPEVTEADLLPSPAGIRAQALRRDGTLVDDFEFADGPRSVHVINAPSPAATASLAIGHEVARRLSDRVERAAH